MCTRARIWCRQACMYIQFYGSVHDRQNGYLFLVGHSHPKLQRCYVFCIIVYIYIYYTYIHICVYIYVLHIIFAKNILFDIIDCWTLLFTFSSRHAVLYCIIKKIIVLLLVIIIVLLKINYYDRQLVHYHWSVTVRLSSLNVNIAFSH